MGFGEASHRDWLETQACCWVHQKQGHCADRQLVQLEDKGPLTHSAPHPHFTPAPGTGTQEANPNAEGKGLLHHQGLRHSKIVRSPLQEVFKEQRDKQGL